MASRSQKKYYLVETTSDLTNIVLISVKSEDYCYANALDFQCDEYNLVTFATRIHPNLLLEIIHICH